MSIRVTFVLPDNERRDCLAVPGDTLLKVGQANGVDIEGACEASLACATCRVVVDPAWYGKLPLPKPEELDMLDLATGRTRTSRLSCQIKLTEALDGLVVRVV